MVVGCIEGGFGCALKVVEGCSDWVVLDVILKLIIRKNKRCDIEKIVKWFVKVNKVTFWCAKC